MELQTRVLVPMRDGFVHTESCYSANYEMKNVSIRLIYITTEQVFNENVTSLVLVLFTVCKRIRDLAAHK